MRTLLASAANPGPARPTGPNARASNDAVLLSRVAGGDKPAMQVLFSNYHVAVYRFVLRRLRNKAQAEDVTGEVFLDVWRHAAGFDGRTAVSTWILAIARRKAFAARPQVLQSHSGGGTSGTGEIDAAAIDAGEINEDLAGVPDAIPDTRNRNPALGRCLAGLSIEHREIIDLVYCQEQSVAAVATILGIPAAAARTRLDDARKLLLDGLRRSGAAPNRV